MTSRGVTGRPVDVVVVGAGPNGLAAAAVLARSGRSVVVLEAADDIGGGTRSAELTVPGVVHDVCSAAHPLGVMSPVFAALPLAEHGLRWRWPELDLVHPLDDGSAGVLSRDLDATCRGLGVDADAWRRIFGPVARGFDALADDLLGPIVHRPKHPIRLARFGLRALPPATLLARRFRTPQARALFAGAAAHAYLPLSAPASSAVGVVLTAAGLAHGWPVAQGGSGAITAALASVVEAAGGTVETGRRVRTLDEMPPARSVLLDVAPAAAADIVGSRLPRRVTRAYRRFRHGPAAFKLDLAVRGGVPWTAEAARRAGVVHVGGTIDELADAEREVVHGRMPGRPFVLVAQQSLADPTRAAGDVHPVWVYAHVPANWDGDATDTVLEQLERFAPGLRARIVATATRGPAEWQAYNPNYVGGDIGGGANDLAQLIARPRLALDPYATGAPGEYLCSASTPPGGGVHGMCGYQAAIRAEVYLSGRTAIGAT